MKTKRLVLGDLALVATLALCVAPASHAQAPAPPAARPTFEERLAAKAAESRHAVSLQNGKLSGPGWDLLVQEGQQSRFFLVGEEHGIAEIPTVVKELFRILQPAGYRHLAIEVSPPMATILDETARGADGLKRLSAFFKENPPGAPFFTLQEEAELLVAARAAVPGADPVLWGLDYEVMGAQVLLDAVRKQAPEGPAKAAAEALYQKAAADWKTVKETQNPGAFFSFANPPGLFDALRQAWPNPDPESALILDVLQETLAINQMFVKGQNWESNQRRAQLNRRNFLRLWNQARTRGTAPRVLFKFGAFHMTRGRSGTEVFDLGNLVSEMAAAEGSQSFHLLVIGAPGTQHAAFNPVKLQYEPAPVALVAQAALQTIVAQALPEGSTLFDLRALRPLFSAARTKTVDPELMRIVHGFDALLVLGGSQSARMLP